MEYSLRLLIVDNSPEDRLLLRRLLQKSGCMVELFEVEDGSEAIAFLAHEAPFANTAEYPRPDIVFLDLRMSGRSGLEVLNWLEEHPSKPCTRVIVLSASDSAWDRNV